MNYPEQVMTADRQWKIGHELFERHARPRVAIYSITLCDQSCYVTSGFLSILYAIYYSSDGTYDLAAGGTGSLTEGYKICPSRNLIVST